MRDDQFFVNGVVVNLPKSKAVTQSVAEATCRLTRSPSCPWRCGWTASMQRHDRHCGISKTFWWSQICLFLPSNIGAWLNSFAWLPNCNELSNARFHSKKRWTFWLAIPQGHTSVVKTVDEVPASYMLHECQFSLIMWVSRIIPVCGNNWEAFLKWSSSVISKSATYW